jgi:hypothetical protein
MLLLDVIGLNVFWLMQNKYRITVTHVICTKSTVVVCTVQSIVWRNVLICAVLLTSYVIYFNCYVDKLFILKGH